jgi:hypothetical protein
VRARPRAVVAAGRGVVVQGFPRVPRFDPGEWLGRAPRTTADVHEAARLFAFEHYRAARQSTPGTLCFAAFVTVAGDVLRADIEARLRGEVL